MVLVERQQQQPFPLLALTMSLSTFSAKIGPSSSFPVSFRLIRSRSQRLATGSTVSEDWSLPYVLYASSACSDTYYIIIVTVGKFSTDLLDGAVTTALRLGTQATQRSAPGSTSSSQTNSTAETNPVLRPLSSLTTTTSTALRANQGKMGMSLQRTTRKKSWRTSKRRCSRSGQSLLTWPRPSPPVMEGCCRVKISSEGWKWRRSTLRLRKTATK